MDLGNKRVLIFIVAYNAEKTIESVLDRIPPEMRTRHVEVYVRRAGSWQIVSEQFTRLAEP